MEIQKLRIIFAVTLSILCISIISSSSYAQAIKTTLADIISHPDQYDGKMVQVEGKVTALEGKVSNRGHPYYTLKLADGDKSLTVYRKGIPSIQEGYSVSVTGMYQKVKHVGQHTLYNEIDASKGTVEKK